MEEMHLPLQRQGASSVSCACVRADEEVMFEAEGEARVARPQSSAFHSKRE